MRSCILNILTLALAGLALGILVFVLLYTGVLTLVPASAVGIAFFSLVTLISAGGLLTLTLAIPVARRSPALADAWLCCGMLAGVGAVGALVTSLLTFLSASLEIGLFIGVALIFIFLFLMTAGLLCFLRRYVTTCFCTADNQ